MNNRPEQIIKRAYKEPAVRAEIVRADCGDHAEILCVARLAFENVSRGSINRHYLK